VSSPGDEADSAPSAGARAAPSSSAAQPSTGPSRAGAPATCRAIASEALFAGASEVQISHRGSLYRLRQTALGKLILTK